MIPSTGNMPLREMKYSELSTSPISSSPFAHIVAEGAVLVGLGRFVGAFGLLLNLLALLLVLRLLAGVVGQHLFGAFSLRAQQVDHVLAHLRGVQLDPRRLVVCPLVVGAGFVNDRRGVFAVAGDRHHRQQYREDGRHDPDLLPQRVGTVFVFVVDFKFGHKWISVL